MILHRQEIKVAFEARDERRSSLVRTVAGIDMKMNEYRKNSAVPCF